MPLPSDCDSIYQIMMAATPDSNILLHRLQEWQTLSRPRAQRQHLTWCAICVRRVPPWTCAPRSTWTRTASSARMPGRKLSVCLWRRRCVTMRQRRAGQIPGAWSEGCRFFSVRVGFNAWHCALVIRISVRVSRTIQPNITLNDRVMCKTWASAQLQQTTCSKGILSVSTHCSAHRSIVQCMRFGLGDDEHMAYLRPYRTLCMEFESANWLRAVVQAPGLVWNLFAAPQNASAGIGPECSRDPAA